MFLFFSLNLVAAISGTFNNLLFKMIINMLVKGEIFFVSIFPHCDGLDKSKFFDS